MNFKEPNSSRQAGLFAYDIPMTDPWKKGFYGIITTDEAICAELHNIVKWSERIDVLFDEFISLHKGT